MQKSKTIFAAEYCDNTVGVMIIEYRHIESPSHITRNIIYIEALAIHENYRGLGIGHDFMDFLQDLRENIKYDGIELQVNARNKSAYRFYLDYGFSDKSVNMELLP